jgi:hypothetical protein
MNVKTLIRKLKKMPQSKEVCFFSHDDEFIYKLDEGVWNVPNTNLNGVGYPNWVEIAGKKE